RYRFAAALELDLHVPADIRVEDFVQRLELSHVVTVDPHEHVPRLEDALAGRAGQYLRDDQHARVLRVGLAHRGFGHRVQAESFELVIGGVVETRVQRASGHRFALLYELERTAHSPERQIEARGGPVGTAGVQGDDPATDIDHG